MFRLITGVQIGMLVGKFATKERCSLAKEMVTGFQASLL